MPKYKGFLASSSDSTQLSLTVESGSKVLIGLIGWFALSKGMDAATATTQVQAILDLAAQMVPMIFALWHACIALFGLVRKFFNLFKTAQQ